MYSKQSIIDDFCRWAREERKPASRQLSNTTLTKYLRILDTFWNDISSPLKATEADILRWRDSINTCVEGERPLSQSTKNVRISALRALFEYLEYTGRRKDNPAKRLSMAALPQTVGRPVAREKIEELLEYLYSLSHTSTVLQDIAIVEILYGSGLRREEAGNLVLCSIEDRTTLKVRGKGDKERITVITPAAYESIQNLIIDRYGDQDPATHEAVRNALGRVESGERENTIRESIFRGIVDRFPNEAIFFTESGRPTTTLRDAGTFIWRRVTIRGREAGVDITPHAFRHSFATHMLEVVPLDMVSRMLGHTTIKTTLRYIGFDDHMWQKAVTTHPRSKMLCTTTKKETL